MSCGQPLLSLAQREDTKPGAGRHCPHDDHSSRTQPEIQELRATQTPGQAEGSLYQLRSCLGNLKPRLGWPARSCLQSGYCPTVPAQLPALWGGGSAWEPPPVCPEWHIPQAQALTLPAPERALSLSEGFGGRLPGGKPHRSSPPGAASAKAKASVNRTVPPTGVPWPVPSSSQGRGPACGGRDSGDYSCPRV